MDEETNSSCCVLSTIVFQRNTTGLCGNYSGEVLPDATLSFVRKCFAVLSDTLTAGEQRR